MGDLNKLTFSEFPEARRNDRGGLWRTFFFFFILVAGVMNSHDMIVVRLSSSCELELVVEAEQSRSER